jgi:RHS repeat-associated protein
VAYLHRDHLGSTTTVTNEAGAVVESLAYEPFGKRRVPDGQDDPANSIVTLTTERGFTNHEHLDELGLIHMNGRIYDPLLGRFTSADPTTPNPLDLQSYNRYSYTRNNPLRMLDPSGFTDGEATLAAGSLASMVERAVAAAKTTLSNWTNAALDATRGGEKAVQPESQANSLASGAREFVSGTKGEYRSVMEPASTAYDVGSGLRTAGEVALSFFPPSALPDIGAALGQREYGMAALLVGSMATGPAGRGVRAEAALERAAAKLEVNAAQGEKTFQTYAKSNATTGEVYCGRTSGCGTPLENLANRDASHHMNDKGFGPAVLDKSSSNAAAIRGREQQLIDTNGGARSSGGTSGNAINGISPSNPNRGRYIGEARREFGQ